MADETDEGVSAISTIIAALKPLDEKTRAHVLDYVLKRLDLPLKAPLMQGEKKADEADESRERTSTLPMKDIRSLAGLKQPRTVNEKVALVAFYLKNMAPQDERRDYITSEDIQRYFVEAGFELPTAPPNVTLGHAKNAGYLNALERGQWRLNPVGHNLVAHKLPAGEGSTRQTRHPAKRKRAKS